MSGKLNTVVHARWFETTIMVVIILAGVLAGLEASPPLVARYGAWLEALDLLVLAIFLVEIGLKLAVHGRQPWHYFREGWNVFDFTIVALCCLPMNAQFAAVLGWRARCACCGWSRLCPGSNSWSVRCSRAWAQWGTWACCWH